MQHLAIDRSCCVQNHCDMLFASLQSSRVVGFRATRRTRSMRFNNWGHCLALRHVPSAEPSFGKSSLDVRNGTLKATAEFTR